MKWLDHEELVEVARLAEAGLPAIVATASLPPANEHGGFLDSIRARLDVVDGLGASGLWRLLTGDEIPPYSARSTAEVLDDFFAQPGVREMPYRMYHEQSSCRERAILGSRSTTRTSASRRVPVPHQEITYRPLARMHTFIMLQRLCDAVPIIV